MAREFGERPADTVSGVGEANLVDLLSPLVRAGSRMRYVGAGEVIVREGEPGGEAFILLSGLCHASVQGEVVNTVRPGELFGEIACLEGATRTATVRATVDSEMLEISGEDLRGELQRSPSILERVLRALAHRVRDISRRETSILTEQRQLRDVLERLRPSLQRFRDHPVLSVAARSEPLSFASGDYYDVLELSPTRVLFALGDVMGHGAPAAPILAMVRSQLHESASAQSRPHELLTHLHHHLQRHGDPNVFMTLILLILDTEASTAEFAIAGPPPPILWRGGETALLTDQPGWTLGYPFNDVAFRTERLAVSKGDTLVLFSDGLSDAARGPNPDRDILGTSGLEKIIREVCPARGETVVSALFAGVKGFRAGWPAEDDATALAITICR